MTERAKIPLQGVQRAVNRNALEGATQLQPTKVQGFDLDRTGGYVTAWLRASTKVFSVPGVVRAYSPDGNALLADSQVLLNNTVHDASGSSIAGKETALVPRVGVVANPLIRGGDEYGAGAFFEDTLGSVGDLNRVSGLTISDSGSGGDVHAGTYRFMIIVEAPTRLGWLAYQILTDEHTVSGDVDDITVTLDTTLPLGYAVRGYWWEPASDEVTFFQLGSRIISDGTAIEVVLDDTDSSGATGDPTSDAVLAFGSRLVEPHRERVWGVGSEQSFVGPFSAGLSADKYFVWKAASAGHALDTPDSGTLDGISSELSVVTSFTDGVTWSTGSGTASSRITSEISAPASSGGLERARVAPSSGHLWVLSRRRGETNMVEYDTDFFTILNTYTLDSPVFSDSDHLPRDFDMDDSDNLYVIWSDGSADDGDVSLSKYDSSASFITGLSQTVSGDHAMWTRIVTDGSGNSYVLEDPDVTDSESTTVLRKFDSSLTGEWNRAFSDSGDCVDLTLNSGGSQVVAFSQSRMRLWTSGGSVSWTADMTTYYGTPEPSLGFVMFNNDGDIVHSRLVSTLRKIVKRDPSDGSIIESSSDFDEDPVHIVQDSFGWYYVITGRPNGVLHKWTFSTGDEWSLDIDDYGFLPRSGIQKRSENLLTFVGDDQLQTYDVSDTWYFPFARRGSQFDVGLKAIRNAGGEESAYFYAAVNNTNYELSVGSAVPNVNGDTSFDSESTWFARQDVQFSVDLADGSSSAVTVTVKDADGSTALTRTSAKHADWGGSFNGTNEDLEVLGYEPGLSGLTGEVRHSAYYVEWYDDDSASTVEAKADADDYSPGSSTFTNSDTGEEWTIDTGNGEVQGGLANLSSTLPPKNIVIYSDINTVNSGDNLNYAYLDFQMSPGGVTGLAATPAGLLAFGENETFLLSGDPSAADFQIQKAFGVFGNDEGVIPGRLGGVVFPIWRGRVYAISLGMGDVDFGSGVQDISEPVFDPQDPFVQVIGEPRSREVVARTESGEILRYSPARQAWFTDVWSEADSLESMIPYPGNSGTRYVVDGDAFTADEGAASPVVEWEDWDFGDKNQRLLWRRAYAYTNDDYAGTPTFAFETEDTSGTISGENEGLGQFSFTFPNGVVASKLKKATLTMAGASLGDSVEAPFEVEFVPRYRRR